VTQPISKDILRNYDLCMTGSALKQFATRPAWIDLVQHVWVYARVSPAQKEFILATLKDLGYTTLMAGDGTNDVGALKRAHIGVALLNGSEAGMKQMAENQKINNLKKVYETQLKFTARFNAPPPPVPAAIAHLYPEVVEAQRKAAEKHKSQKENNKQPVKVRTCGFAANLTQCRASSMSIR
jgi:cation-transporting ATPase 13A1